MVKQDQKMYFVPFSTGLLRFARNDGANLKL
jgi:hypothetical protein